MINTSDHTMLSCIDRSYWSSMVKNFPSCVKHNQDSTFVNVDMPSTSSIYWNGPVFDTRTFLASLRQLAISSKDATEKSEEDQKPVDSSSRYDIDDPSCDPNHPVTVNINDVKNAYDCIKNNLIWSPCTKSNLSSLTDCELYFKKDFLQVTGSFKERGVFYLLNSLKEEERKKGVITASAGNHSSALCYHCYAMGIPVVVVMPTNAVLTKINQCKKYKATIILKGENLLEAKKYGLQLAKTKNMIYINGYDHPKIIAGQGTMGLEILKDVPDVDAVVIPVGGGSLLAGISIAIKNANPKCQIIGVESENCPSFSAALKAGKQAFVQPLSGKTLSDGLQVPIVGINTLETAKKHIEKIVITKEENIALAVYRLVQMEKLVVEGSAACAVAAILSGQLPELRGKKVVIPLTGCNIDITTLNQCLEYGMQYDRRIIKLQIVLPDESEKVTELIQRVTKLGAKIRNIYCSNECNEGLFNKEVILTCETRDSDHYLELENALSASYKNITFTFQEKKAATLQSSKK